MSLSNKLAKKISSELNYDSEKSAVISYGLFAFIQVIASLALVVLFGFLFGVVVQALIVSFASSILRQYSGGVHATRPSICLLIGTVVTIAIAVLVNIMAKFWAVELLLAIDVLLIGCGYYLIVKYAPVDSAAKPIRTQAKRKKMKKTSLIVLFVYFMFIIILTIIFYITRNRIFVEYASCICVAVGWQVFNLTIIGHRILGKVDLVINKIFFKERRKLNEKN